MRCRNLQHHVARARARARLALGFACSAGGCCPLKCAAVACAALCCVCPLACCITSMLYCGLARRIASMLHGCVCGALLYAGFCLYALLRRRAWACIVSCYSLRYCAALRFIRPDTTMCECAFYIGHTHKALLYHVIACARSGRTRPCVSVPWVCVSVCVCVCACVCVCINVCMYSVCVCEYAKTV